MVAGADDTTVTTQDGAELDATPIYYEPRQDLALLRVGAALPTLPISGKRREGEDAAVLGYPENGPYSLAPARIGETRETISEDSYGNGPVERTIVALSGAVRSGNSGGPLVDARGRGCRDGVCGDYQRAARAGLRFRPSRCGRRLSGRARRSRHWALYGLSPRRRFSPSLTFCKLGDDGAGHSDAGSGERREGRFVLTFTMRSS